MIALWVMFLLDAETGLEVVGEEDWFACRVVLVSPSLGFGVKGGWVASPRGLP